MSEFAFNSNAGIYSKSHAQAGALSSAPQTAVSAQVAAATAFNHAEEVAEPANMLGERQIELLLWLSNLELRLPPYGDLN